MAGFTAAEVPRLKLKWAFGFPGELSADAQPTVAGGRVFVGTQSGNVYSLSAATGCVHWFFQAPPPCARPSASAASKQIPDRATRRSLAIAPPTSTRSMRPPARCCGKRKWTIIRSRGSPASPAFHNGRLYVGVASGEETAGATADYECCRFRGSLVALNGATGRTDLEDVHDRRRGAADDEEQDRHADVGAVGRAHLDEPGDRRQAERRVRHHRKQLQRSADQHQRRLRRVRSGFRQDPLVPPDDGCRTPGTPPAACRTRSTAPNPTGPISISPLRRSW